MMTEEKKLELLADVFDCDAEELSPEKGLEDLLDSMSSLSLIVLMDDECGKTLTRDQIKAFKTVGDILDFMG